MNQKICSHFLACFSYVSLFFTLLFVLFGISRFGFSPLPPRLAPPSPLFPRETSWHPSGTSATESVCAPACLRRQLPQSRKNPILLPQALSQMRRMNVYLLMY